jgi:bifunctional UDP-N-acetylglucosamine pyrophosphorylase / glucosamine-1-phosphate N-acetyltransferase
MAAGLGTRMRSSVPKHLHPLLGRRMVDWVLEAARPLAPDPLVVVSSPETADAFDEVVAVQQHALGTGDAVRTARDALAGCAEVLVLSGDTPLLTTRLLEELLGTHQETGADATVLSFVPDDLKSYGRIVRDTDGDLRAIVEAVDATPEELQIEEANSSIYVFRADALWPALERLTPANAQGELYLTDAVRGIVDGGGRVAVHVAADAAEAEGVNTRVELAAAGAVLRGRILEAHMLAGVTITDPATTWIDPGVTIEPDATVESFTVLRGATVVREGASIGPHAVVIDAEIGARAIVGPFCYVRPGTVLGTSSKAGTFVELKNARVGDGAKVPHLSYMGDAEIGDGTNIGAGSITANLGHRPGSPKERTVIGRDVRVAVDTMFVAPVSIGDDAWIGAGSVITDDVPAGALAIARARQVNKEGRGGGKRND